MVTNHVLDVFTVAVIRAGGKDGKIIEVNEQMCDLTGWTRNDLVGRSVDVLIPQRSRAAHKYFRKGYMVDPEPRPMGIDRAVHLVHKSGEEIRVWVALAPVDGDVTVVITPMDHLP